MKHILSTYISYINYFSHSTQNPESFRFKFNSSMPPLWLSGRRWSSRPKCCINLVARCHCKAFLVMLERQVQPKENLKIKGDKFVDVLGGLKKENYLLFKYFASPSFWHATRADPILIVLGWHWSHSICFKIAKAVGHALPRSQAATAAP